MEASYMLLLRGTGRLKPGELVYFSEMDTVNCLVKKGHIHSNTAFEEGHDEKLVFDKLYKKDDYRAIGGVKLEKNAPPFTKDRTKVIINELQMCY